MPPPDSTDPSRVAALARTAVDCARAGQLTTYPRPTALPPLVSPVAVTAREDGSVVAHVDAGGLAARMLLARPLATVQVAPAGFEPVAVLGAARRLPGRDEQGRLAFRVEVGAVRLGHRREVCVDAVAYAHAEPDPLRHVAAALLEHLNAGHRDALAACLRALGHDAETAEATRLDQHGLDALAVGLSGVSAVRLAFPTPVRRPEDLVPGPGAVLLCRCGSRDREPS